MTKNVIHELSEALQTLTPVLNPGSYVFGTLPAGIAIPDSAIGTFREKEGISVILEESEALRLGISSSYRAAWISLFIQTDLAMVGLTATLSRALADEGISCNVVAANYHDHFFVPVERAEDAIKTLKTVQKGTMKCSL